MPYRAVIRTHPARTAASALRDAERAFDRFHRPGPVTGWATRFETGFAPRLQADETETEYVVTAELPGVEASDLNVSVEDGVLTLTGARKAAGWSEELADEEKRRLVASFKRRVRFNGEIDEGAVHARYRNGLLTVTVPKPQPKVVTIPVQAS